MPSGAGHPATGLPRASLSAGSNSACMLPRRVLPGGRRDLKSTLPSPNPGHSARVVGPLIFWPRRRIPKGNGSGSTRVARRAGAGGSGAPGSCRPRRESPRSPEPSEKLAASVFNAHQSRPVTRLSGQGALRRGSPLNGGEDRMTAGHFPQHSVVLGNFTGNQCSVCAGAFGIVVDPMCQHGLKLARTRVGHARGLRHTPLCRRLTVQKQGRAVGSGVSKRIRDLRRARIGSARRIQ